MSLTPARLDELALEVAKKFDGFVWHEDCGHETGVIEPELKDYARALLAAVEAELVPVAWQWREGDNPFGLDHTYEHEVIATTDYSEVRKLISLPLIKEKS